VKTILCPLIILIVIGCNPLHQRKEDRPVARVYDEFLYEEDLFNIVPNAATLEDSSELSHRFINNWIEERLVLHLANL